jgi:hypothetical protein
LSGTENLLLLNNLLILTTEGQLVGRKIFAPSTDIKSDVYSEARNCQEGRTEQILNNAF